MHKHKLDQRASDAVSGVASAIEAIFFDMMKIARSTESTQPTIEQLEQMNTLSTSLAFLMDFMKDGKDTLREGARALDRLELWGDILQAADKIEAFYDPMTQGFKAYRKEKETS